MKTHTDLIAVFILAASASLIAPSQASAEERWRIGSFEIGAGLGAYFYQDIAAYAGNARYVTGKLGGSMTGSFNDTINIVPILTQTWCPLPWFSLELKERFWMYVVKGTFNAPPVNFRIEKDIIPVNLDVRFGLYTDSRSFGFNFFLGPGMYIVNTNARGHFADGNSLTVAPGFNVGIAFAVGLGKNVFFRIAGNYDWFQLPTASVSLADGGNGGGGTASIGFEYLFK